jgi:HAD superfamily 5'-nucleotidase-like hydrolase
MVGDIFVNRNLRMDCVHAIGFDMDYTLVRYARAPIEALAYDLTLAKLHKRGYPQEILNCRYDPSFVIRGLVVDRLLGNIIKLDRHNHPARVLHGRRPLSREARRETYRREHLSFVAPRFMSVDTLFSMPEVCLYADLVDFFDARHKASCKPDYGRLFDDIRSCIDEAHRDQSLKSAICQNLPHYIEVDAKLAMTLRKLRSSGKKLFIITNSLWDYTDVVMAHILNNVLPEYPKWTDYFDTVVTGAKKPDFFVGTAPLVSLDATGAALPVPAGLSLVPLDRSRERHPHLFFSGGHKTAVEDVLGVRGEEVLYVGDHIFGDILRSKKTSLWRTALVVEELDDEIANTRAQAGRIAQLEQLEAQRTELDKRLNLQRHNLSVQGRLVSPALRLERDAAKDALKRVLAQISERKEEIAGALNPLWGMTFKEDHENSRFGEQVAHYACLYTSRVSNFYAYSSFQYFRSPKDLMPHERDL